MKKIDREQEIANITQDILRNLLNRVENYTVIHASREDLKQVKKIQARLCKLIFDTQPISEIEWREEHEDE